MVSCIAFSTPFTTIKRWTLKKHTNKFLIKFAFHVCTSNAILCVFVLFFIFSNIVSGAHTTFRECVHWECKNCINHLNSQWVKYIYTYIKEEETTKQRREMKIIKKNATKQFVCMCLCVCVSLGLRECVCVWIFQTSNEIFRLDKFVNWFLFFILTRGKKRHQAKQVREKTSWREKPTEKNV